MERMDRPAKVRGAVRGAIGVVATGLFALAFMTGCQSAMMNMMPQSMKDDMMAKTAAEMQQIAPAKGYLAAHAGNKRPQPILGGPIHVKIRQASGGVFVSLPDQRRLDPDVFGTPDHPRAFGGTPGINGVPLMPRMTSGGQYTKLMKMTPFGDKHIVLPGGQLQLKGTDATATDAATTNDSVQMKASWKDRAGNRYEVKCCKMMAAHGIEYPTFGGVVTNHILHGFTRIGTSLMPSEFTYFAFWGMGQVSKNGRVLDKPRLIHGMLTENVRTKGYKLGFDSDVSPGRTQFHLMVPPFAPNPKEGRFDPKPVKTGMKLPNGMTLPFWHVMFENLQVDSTRG